MASSKMASAIGVRIDDVGSILKFRIGFPFGENSAGFLPVRVAPRVDAEFPYRVRIVDRGVDCRDPVCRHRFRFLDVFFQKGGFGGCSPERKPERGCIRMFPPNENWNEGTFACSPGTKTGTRARSPKPPFYEAALLSHGEKWASFQCGTVPQNVQGQRLSFQMVFFRAMCSKNGLGSKMSRRHKLFENTAEILSSVSGTRCFKSKKNSCR